jgi:hypothetical protein
VYNILCDSLGIEPMPNNGTLRLPLKPVGIHRPEDTPGGLADPQEESTTTPESNNHKKPTVAADTSAVGRPTVPARPTPSQSDNESSTDQPAPSDEGKDAEPADGDSSKGGIKGIWNWLTGEVEKVWHKITGSG